MEEVYRMWFRKAMATDTGSKLFLPADNKVDAQWLKRVMEEERTAYSVVDPQGCASIAVTITFRDSRFWVVLTKRKVSPLVAYIKDSTNHVAKLNLKTDVLRMRMLSRLINNEAKTLEEVEKIVGPLSKDEKEFFNLLPTKEDEEGKDKE